MSVVAGQYQTGSGQTIEVRQGDLTAEDTDAIVNAANSHLAHGGGVAGAIVSRGGRVIQAESDRWVDQHGPVPTGQVAVTAAGSLPARVVIHAVGPVWGEGDEDNKLGSAVTGSLRVADELKCSSIALPAISTGIFGFPKDRAAGIIFSAIDKYFVENSSSGLRHVRLVLFDTSTIDVFVNRWRVDHP